MKKDNKNMFHYSEIHDVISRNFNQGFWFGFLSAIVLFCFGAIMYFLYLASH